MLFCNIVILSDHIAYYKVYVVLKHLIDLCHCFVMHLLQKLKNFLPNFSTIVKMYVEILIDMFVRCCHCHDCLVLMEFYLSIHCHMFSSLAVSKTYPAFTVPKATSATQSSMPYPKAIACDSCSTRYPPLSVLLCILLNLFLYLSSDYKFQYGKKNPQLCVFGVWSTVLSVLVHLIHV